MVDNGRIRIANLEQAAYLLVHNVPYHGLERPDPNSKQALFVFDKPPDKVAAGWFTDGETYHNFREACEKLKDEIFGGRRT